MERGTKGGPVVVGAERRGRRLAVGCKRGDMKDHIDALLETPSGFALFSINEDVLEKADVIWVHFRDAAAAECAMSILGYVKIDDKNSAWEGKTHASKNLLGLVARFCNDRNQLYVETANLALNINQKLEVNCYYDKNVIEELMWGIKNVLHEFIPEEKDNITPASLFVMNV
ncbi:hypothetical protein EJB05_48724, partial [Eragrostis curvula]